MLNCFFNLNSSLAETTVFPCDKTVPLGLRPYLTENTVRLSYEDPSYRETINVRKCLSKASVTFVRF